MFVIKKLDTVNEIQKLARLAEVIWHEHFPGLISQEQIDYMVAQDSRANQRSVINLKTRAIPIFLAMWTMNWLDTAVFALNRIQNVYF